MLYVLLVGTVLTSFFSSIQIHPDPGNGPQRVRHPAQHPGGQFQQYQHRDHPVLAWCCWRGSSSSLRKELALLDVLTLGKDQAINLGVDYDRCIRRLLLGVTLCIAVATAMVGPISFLGLIIANLSRQLLQAPTATAS